MTWGDWMHGTGWWMALWVLVFWGGLITVTVLLTRVHFSGREERGASRAEQLLAERYARGEIDTEEFQERTREIEAASR